MTSSFVILEPSQRPKISLQAVIPMIPRSWKPIRIDLELFRIRGDLSDVYSLGLIMWFLQNGGAEPPNNIIDIIDIYVDDGGPFPRFHQDLRSHNVILDISNLFLGDLMRMCWVPQTSRFTSRGLLDHLLGIDAQES
jgi:hypothetical protein